MGISSRRVREWISIALESSYARQQRREAVTKLADVSAKLQANEIEDLTIGLFKSMVKFHHTASLHDKYMKVFLRSLAANRSIKSVSIGPIISLHHLKAVLKAIAFIPTLQSLSLNAQTWIPEPIMTSILAAPNQLHSLELENTRIEKACYASLTRKQKKRLFDQPHFLIEPTMYYEQQENLTKVLAPHLHKMSQTLKIRSCGWSNSEIVEFCHHLKNDKTAKIQNFVIETTTRQEPLEPTAIHAICTCNKIYRLDFSECYLSNPSLFKMTTSLTKESSIQELCLAKNYTVPCQVIKRLIEVFCYKKALDLSYCNVDTQTMRTIFNVLKQSSCTLQTLYIHDAFKVPVDALQEMLQVNTSLQEIVLCHPRGYNSNHLDPDTSFHQLQIGLQRNTTLTKLQLDWPNDTVRNMVDFYLMLNQHEQDILQTEYDNAGWSTLMSGFAASKNPSCVFWALQEFGGTMLKE